MKLITLPPPVNGFRYSDAPQRSPEWIQIRTGRIGSSQLGAWTAVAKRADKDGKFASLAPRKALEREIAFAKGFSVPFEKFTNDAMQAGIDNEDFVADQYSSQMGVELAKVGCYYNDYFVASPDRWIVGTNGGVEIKWLFDNSWSEVVATGVIDPAHVLQMQGQMWATGWNYVDYVAANGHTGRFIVIRVDRDDKVIAEISKSVVEVESIVPMDSETPSIFEFSKEAPETINKPDWE